MPVLAGLFGSALCERLFASDQFPTWRGGDPASNPGLAARVRSWCTNNRGATKENMQKEWFDPLPHTHKALDDAIEQRRALLQHSGCSSSAFAFPDVMIAKCRYDNQNDLAGDRAHGR